MESKNCWNCAHKRTGGSCFPLACNWFVEAGKDEKPRQVPAHIVDVGCGLWREEE